MACPGFFSGRCSCSGKRGELDLPVRSEYGSLDIGCTCGDTMRHAARSPPPSESSRPTRQHPRCRTTHRAHRRPHTQPEDADKDAEGLAAGTGNICALVADEAAAADPQSSASDSTSRATNRSTSTQSPKRRGRMRRSTHGASWGVMLIDIGSPVPS